MIRDPVEQNAQPFADLVMNLLAILIIVTLVLIILVRAAIVPTQYAVLEPTERDRVLPLGRLGGIQRFSKRFYVTASGVYPVDLAPIAQAILGSERGLTAKANILGEGWQEADLLILPQLAPSIGVSTRTTLMDPGEYRVNIQFPEDTHPPLPLDQNLTYIRSLLKSTATDIGMTPYFLVAPSGFDLFTRIERELVTERSCFRWSYVLSNRKKRNEIDLVKNSNSARSFEARRCNL